MDGITVRAMPPRRSLILRITFIGPLWGVLLACFLIAGFSVAASIRYDGPAGLLYGLGAIVTMLPWALMFGYPIGILIAFATAWLLVLVVRQFGWSRSNAIATAAVPGVLFGLVVAALLGSWVGGLGTLIVCLGAAALTWWSSLRGMLKGSQADLAALFD